MWDRQSNSLVARLNSDGTRHTDMIYGVAINIFNQVVSCSHDSSIAVWQYDNINVSYKIPPNISFLKLTEFVDLMSHRIHHRICVWCLL